MAHADTVLATMEAMMAASGTPDGAFTYESVVSDTDTGFEITGVKMEPEPGQGIVTIDRLRIDAIDMAATQAGSPPAFMDLTAEGVTVPYDMLDADSQAVFPNGMRFDIGVDYELDMAAQALKLNEIAFSVPDYGDIVISADLTGLSMEAIAGAMFAGPEALSAVTLNNASITLDDDGGLAELLSLAAAEEGMDLDSFVEQAMLPQMQMMGAMFAADPMGAGVVDSLVNWISDYGDPQGPLTITAAPSTPVSLMSLLQLTDPTSLPSMLGLGSSYEGGSRERGTDEPADDQQGSLFGQDSQTEAAVDEAAPAPTGGDGAFATLMAMASAAGMPDNALTYDAVLSDTPDGFVLSNVRFEPEPGDVIEIGMLSVGSIDMDSIAAGGPPLSLQLSAQGLVLPLSEMDSDLQEMLGDEPVEANFTLDYAFDPATGSFDVNALTLEMVDLGSLTFTLAMEEVTVAGLMGLAGDDPEAFGDALLERAALSYTDHGFLQQMVAFGAAEEGMTEEAMIAEALAGLDQARPMFAADPIASAALDAVRSFLADYQAPHGPITIAFNPPTPVSMAEIDSVADPSQVPQMLGMVIGY
ncbi:MAG: hypothetical protein ACFCVH_05585 [Alphaproteobacteria bacterium]